MITTFILIVAYGIIAQIISWLPETGDMPTGLEANMTTFFGWVMKLNDIFPVDTVLYLVGINAIILAGFVGYFMFNYGLRLTVAVKKLLFF